MHLRTSLVRMTFGPSSPIIFPPLHDLVEPLSFMTGFRLGITPIGLEEMDVIVVSVPLLVWRRIKNLGDIGIGKLHDLHLCTAVYQVWYPSGV